ncbi:MAG: LAGLIDADG family homing endonuclease, partial [Planctomycetota bacterium]
HQNVCRDLIALGLHPRKSLTLRFPDAPDGVHRHFIRGCWDGDGSIYKSGNGPSAWNAKFISASPAFIRGIHDSLVSGGMPPVTIHQHGQSVAEYFRWTGRRCVELFHILYDGVPESQYLLRKYERFRTAAADNGRHFAGSRPPAKQRE